MPSYVVLPEPVRYELSTGDWIVVKKRLNAGEYRQMMGRMMGTVQVKAGQTTMEAVPIDPMQATINIVLAHLLDWSLIDPAGTPMPLRDPLTGDRVSVDLMTTYLDAISIDVYTEIERVIQEHYGRERSEEKKTTALSSRKTSPSLAAVTGAMNG